MEKVDAMLKREIATILNEKLSMEEAGLITVTQVVTADDLKDATVWVSVLGADVSLVVDNLNEKVWEIKSYLKEREIKLKYLPNLHFKADRTAEKAARVDELLKEIEKEKKS